jgi:hypothetical protein
VNNADTFTGQEDATNSRHLKADVAIGEHAL